MMKNVAYITCCIYDQFGSLFLKEVIQIFIARYYLFLFGAVTRAGTLATAGH